MMSEMMEVIDTTHLLQSSTEIINQIEEIVSNLYFHEYSKASGGHSHDV